MYGYRCQTLYPDVCEQTENLQVDHLIPKSLGGTDDIENLRVLCRRCNTKRQNKMVVEKSEWNPKWFDKPLNLGGKVVHQQV